MAPDVIDALPVHDQEESPTRQNENSFSDHRYATSAHHRLMQDHASVHGSDDFTRSQLGSNAAAEEDVCFPVEHHHMGHADHNTPRLPGIDIEYLQTYIREEIEDRKESDSAYIAPARRQRRPTINGDNLYKRKMDVHMESSDSEVAISTEAGDQDLCGPRFSFFNGELENTIHATSISDIAADGKTLVDFLQDRENCFWLDVLAPTDTEMKALSKVFRLHPLTTEDIQMEETREKVELFRFYYFICFRSFDQDPLSPTYLEPLNMYLVVTRQGIISFHFKDAPHPANVRGRIRQLKDYINVSPDWICYALIDDITDAFAPLIRSIEFEVDSIDELVLLLEEVDESNMLRRIGAVRKKVMGLLRLLGNKADVIKGLSKRCNENWEVAPRSDIGLYLGDIIDHIVTMLQGLTSCEKVLSRSHSNYLAQISIEMNKANNKINAVLSRLTLVGTVLLPMNLITGLFGMNVKIPGYLLDVDNYGWFVGIVAVMFCIGCMGAFVSYKFLPR